MAIARSTVIEAVYCLRCGGPADEKSRAARSCSYCRAPLVPLDHPDPRHSVPCGACAAAVPVNSRYCGHCGHPARSENRLADASHPCPGCGHQAMHRWELDGQPGAPEISVCADCGGSFVSHATFNQLVEREHARYERSLAAGEIRLDRVQRFTISSASAVLEQRRCPQCDQPMARRNYARLSGVILDQCHRHGAYLDAGELAQILAFVRSGGLAVDRERRAKERHREEKQRSEYLPMRTDARLEWRNAPVDRWHWGVSDLIDLFNLGARLWGWIRHKLNRP